MLYVMSTYSQIEPEGLSTTGNVITGQSLMND